MKKLLVLLLIVALCATSLVVFAACEPTDVDIAIALITDKGDINDKSFNQGAWEGVKEYAKDNSLRQNRDFKYYKPAEVSATAYLATIDLAVLNGAKVVVCPGFLFEQAVWAAQYKYPQVNFILLDGSPNNVVDWAGIFYSDYTDLSKTSQDWADMSTEVKANVASVFYAEEESGFLAGYAAVKDGFTKLGFMGGMDVPAVRAFGFGYLQGAEYAAKEMGKADGSITIRYHYTGDFADTPVNKGTASSMYTAGTEVIFACGGSVGKSVMSAATESKKKVIGVDVNQKSDSATVITSATKALGVSVVDVLNAWKNGSFATYGGKSTYFTAANDGVGLPNDFSRFQTFKATDYTAIFTKLTNGTIKSESQYTTGATLLRNVPSVTDTPTMEEIMAGLKLTKITLIKV